ncbi:MAG: glycosyltransferase [Bacteroidota bacterium]
MKSLKVVHCANFSESKFGQVFYSIDRKITNGLIRNGHFVYDFSYREIAKSLTFLKRKKLGAKKMNEKLLETIHNVNPDLLLLGHSELVYTSTLKQIKESFPDIKIAMWWVDPFDRIAHINDRLSYLDVFFATTSPEYYKQFFTNRTNFEYMPNMCDDSIETLKAFENQKYDYDLIFIGRSDDNRKDFINKLSDIEEIDFKIFGNNKNSLIFGQDFLNTLTKSKMAVNYSRYNDIPLYSSDRVIQLLAQGSLVFSPKVPELDTLFTEDEIVYFNDFDDLKEKLIFYKMNEEKRVEISKKGWEKAHTLFNSTLITEKMIENIFKSPNQEQQ